VEVVISIAITKRCGPLITALVGFERAYDVVTPFGTVWIPLEFDAILSDDIYQTPFTVGGSNPGDYVFFARASLISSLVSRNIVSIRIRSFDTAVAV